MQKAETKGVAAKASVTSKGQVTIPKTIRDMANIQEHDTLIFQPEADGSINLSVSKEPTQNFSWAHEQALVAKYGKFDESELDWGLAVGEEKIDDD